MDSLKEDRADDFDTVKEDIWTGAINGERLIDATFFDAESDDNKEDSLIGWEVPEQYFESIILVAAI